MKIAITTGNGKIGSRVIQLLHNRADIVAAVRNPKDTANIESMGAKAIVGELTDQRVLKQLFEDADVAFLVIPTNLMADDYTDYVIKMARGYCLALNEAKVPKLVFLSAVFPEHKNKKGFMRTHGVAEEEFRNHFNGSITFLRSTNFLSNLFYFLSDDKSILASPLDLNKPLSWTLRQELAEEAAGQLINSEKGIKSISFRSFGKEYSVAELGQFFKIHLPSLNLNQITPEQFVDAVKQSGASASFARCLGSTWEMYNEEADDTDYKTTIEMDISSAISELLQK